MGLETTKSSSGPGRPNDGERALLAGLLRSLSAFRGITLSWAALGVVLSVEYLDHKVWAGVLLAAMVLTTLVVTTWPNRRSILPASAAWVVAFELAVGSAVLIGDGLVYSAERPQSLPWAWPAAAVMAAGILYGKRAGVASAIVAGAAGFVAEVSLLDRSTSPISSASKVGLWILAGLLAGYVADRLRRAESEISVVRAREEVARQLHDGVLQTLAVIQRRSTDTELASLARDQEHDLRGFLSGSATTIEGFEPEVRRLAARFESVFGARVDVVIATDLPGLDDTELHALTGAIGEALTNAGKHGSAANVTIYAEPAADISGSTERVFASVRDNGEGFDVGAVTERLGLTRSIRGRMADVGGRVDIASQPGRGTEVKLWI